MTAFKEDEHYLYLFTNEREKKLEIDNLLRAKDSNAENDPRYQLGSWDGYVRYYETQILENGILFKVNKGLKDKILKNISFDEIGKMDFIQQGKPLEFIKSIIPELPFLPYKHQLQGFMHLTSSNRAFASMCTSSGKSLVAYMLVRYFLKLNKKIIILVPTISLVSQLESDFRVDYKAPKEVIDDIELIGGEFQEKKLKKSVVISTYQSLVKVKHKLKDYDVILVDEAHLAGAESYKKILKENFEYNLAMTGSVPIIKTARMSIEEVFSDPKFIIKARELMDMGLLTDSVIHPIFLNYSKPMTKGKSKMKYQEEVKFIKESVERREFISKFTKKLDGLKVLLFNHTDHGKEQYKDITGEYPPTGKKAFDRMKELEVFFINGGTASKVREQIRIYTNTLKTGIIVANYKVFSTGINLPNLKHLILLSSTKSYTTIMQSLGRVFRLKENKNIAQIWDFVDVFIFKKESYALKHFWERLAAYTLEGHKISEREIDLDTKKFTRDKKRPLNVTEDLTVW